MFTKKSIDVSLEWICNKEEMMAKNRYGLCGVAKISTFKITDENIKKQRRYTELKNKEYITIDDRDELHALDEWYDAHTIYCDTK